MNAKRIGGTAAVITLLASGVYFFLYLYRWEWNRAQVSAAIFVAAEVGIVGWLVSDRIRRVERRLDRMAATAQERRLHVLREHAPRAARHVRRGSPAPTARPSSSPSCSEPAPSCPAWRGSSSGCRGRPPGGPPSTASRIASAAIEPPSGGLLDGGDDPLAILRGPRP